MSGYVRSALTVAAVVAGAAAVAGLAGPGAAVASSRAHVSGCKPAPRPYSLAAPSKALLSVVGVLREPATAADRARGREFLAAEDAYPGRFSGHITFINDFRLARTVDGTSYYLVPVIRVSCDGSESAESVEVIGDGAYCCDAPSDIAQGGANTSVASGPGNSTSTLVTLIPDGVASVTIHLPAGTTSHFPRLPDGKLEHQYNKAYTTTTRIVGNLLVVTLPGPPGRLDKPLTLQWRSATGQILRTFSAI
jgi:hypothetical protein